jgi:hypothetical protein
MIKLMCLPISNHWFDPRGTVPKHKLVLDNLTIIVLHFRINRQSPKEKFGWDQYNKSCSKLNYKFVSKHWQQHEEPCTF